MYRDKNITKCHFMFYKQLEMLGEKCVKKKQGEK